MSPNASGREAPPYHLLALSLALSLLTYPALFLILPVLVLPPVALYFGFQFFRRTVKARPDLPWVFRLLAALPMGVAIWMFLICWNVIATGYRA